jgi:hypothetical protein
MQLKETITKLRRENATLSEALCLICSSSPDWDALVRSLPEHVASRLPAQPPSLLTPPATTQRALLSQSAVSSEHTNLQRIVKSQPLAQSEVWGSVHHDPAGSCTDQLHAVGPSDVLRESDRPLGLPSWTPSLCQAAELETAGAHADVSTTQQHSVNSGMGATEGPVTHSAQCCVAGSTRQDAEGPDEDLPERGLNDIGRAAEEEYDQ